MSLEPFMLLVVPLYHCGDNFGRPHQLSHVGLIVIILTLILVIIGRFVHRGDFGESISPV